MRQYANANFNAARLVALGDLDIRGVAKAEASLIADAYFSRVEHFLENAPQYMRLLGSATLPEELAEIQAVLHSIGANALAENIASLSRVLAGDAAITPELSRAEIIAKFNRLYRRTESAYRKKKRRGEPPKKEESDITLMEALQYLEYEEEVRKLRILAVDDVAAVLNTVTSVLSKHFEVFGLTKASQVESFLHSNTPELFLLDIEMPDMDGYELVRLIRSFEEHRDTPIIFLTGNASMENLKNAIAHGVCDFVVKPLNADILLEKIWNNIVRKKSL